MAPAKQATRRKATAPKARTSAAPRAKAPAVEPKRSEETPVAVVAVRQSRFSKSAVKLAATLAMMVLLGIFAGVSTWSAFSSTTDNTGNSFEAGTVVLTDNDSGTSMLALANAKPGDSDVSCINVSYTGTLASSVRLFGTTTGTGLDQYMDLVVTRGTGAAGFNDCTGFTPDGANHIGAGAGVVYSGTLQDFGDSYGAAVVDPTAGTPEVWTSGESHVYRFDVALQDNNAAQGLNATQSFTWEARNN